MIKSGEAMADLREIAESITSKQWQKLTPKIERIRGYISEQEKKDELLELYRESYKTSDNEIEKLLELDKQIKSLEEELK